MSAVALAHAESKQSPQELLKKLTPEVRLHSMPRSAAVERLVPVGGLARAVAWHRDAFE